jgi:hypothetical protein
MFGVKFMIDVIDLNTNGEVIQLRPNLNAVGHPTVMAESHSCPICVIERQTFLADTLFS